MKTINYLGFVLKSAHRGAWHFGPIDSVILEHSATSLKQAKRDIRAIVAYCR